MTDPRKTKEWDRLKIKVYARYGRKCMATGLEEKDGVILSVDHIKPVKTHPHLALKLSNLQILELGLNKTKGARIVKDWRPLQWRFYYLSIRVIKVGLVIAGIGYLGYTITGPHPLKSLDSFILFFKLLFEFIDLALISIKKSIPLFFSELLRLIGL